MCFLIIPHPPRSTLTATLFPYTPLFRSLHDGISEPQRHVARRIRRGARPAARHGERQSEADLGTARRPARRRDAEGRYRYAAADRLWPVEQRCEYTDVDRLARALCQIGRASGGDTGWQ